MRMLDSLGLLLNIFFLFFLYVFIWRISKTSFSFLFEKNAEKKPGVSSKSEEYVLTDGASHEFKLDKGPLTVGRSDDCDIRLADEFVSHHHATFFSKNAMWYIRDENSTNGTFVNGKQIFDSAPLENDDRITFGRPTLRVRISK